MVTSPYFPTVDRCVSFILTDGEENAALANRLMDMAAGVRMVALSMPAMHVPLAPHHLQALAEHKVTIILGDHEYGARKAYEWAARIFHTVLCVKLIRVNANDLVDWVSARCDVMNPTNVVADELLKIIMDTPGLLESPANAIEGFRK